MLAEILKAARSVARADAACFALSEGDQCYYLAEDSREPLWRGQRFPQSICISGWAIQNRTTAVVADALSDTRLPYNIYESTFVRSLVMCPSGHPEPIGALGVYWAKPKRPSPRVVRAIESLAADAAVRLRSCGTETPTFNGKPFPVNRHVCGFFRGPDEQYRMLLGFIKEGFERGEKAVHVVKKDNHRAHVDRLSAAGIDAERALRTGQLELLGWEDTYLSRGRFEMTRMPALIESLIRKARADGYPLLRYVGNMEWSLENCPGVEDVLAYESELHPLLLRYPDPIVCCYNVGAFPSEFVVDMLRVHESAIVCGILNENPYFVPPERYLAELGEQRVQTA